MHRFLAGFGPLYRAAVKQNAHLIAPWVVLISALSVSSLLAYGWIFPDQAQRMVLAVTIQSNPAFSLIFGPGHNLLTADGFNAWRSLALGSFFAGLMAILIVIRETRAKEDSGQAELIGSSVVGRYTQLAVGVALAWAASIVLGIVAATATILCGGDITSSIMLASAFAASGIMFASVAAITSQIGSFAGTATSLATAFLGISFLVRGYADTSPDAGWLIWWTPFGWLEKIEPAGANSPLPLVIAAVFAIYLVAFAALMAARRDFGQGMLPDRPGKARGQHVSVFALSLRIHRASILTWTLAFTLLGTVFGFLVSSLGSVFTQNAQFAQFLAAGGPNIDLTFEFIGTLLKILGIIAAVYGVGIMMRYFKEELENRVDPLLAGAVPRPKLYASHVLVAFIGPAVAITLAGAMIALITQSRGVDINSWDIVRQAVIEIPAIWILIGLSVAMIGHKPVVRFGAWMAIVATFALTILGPMFKLWDWVLAISPLWHVPNIAATSPDWIQLLWLSLVVVFLLVAGFKGYTSRDIARI